MSDDERPPRSQQQPYTGPSRAAPYALSRLSGKVSLTDVAREIEQADQWIASTAGAQLTLIAEQMAALRDKAQQVLEQARINAELHRAEARFTRVPGKIYHLYQRTDQSRYWSMLSPDEWHGSPPDSFVGSFRLEADRSWTPAERILEQGGPDAELADWLRLKLPR